MDNTQCNTLVSAITLAARTNRDNTDRIVAALKAVAYAIVEQRAVLADIDGTYDYYMKENK